MKLPTFKSSAMVDAAGFGAMLGVSALAWVLAVMPAQRLARGGEEVRQSLAARQSHATRIAQLSSDMERRALELERLTSQGSLTLEPISRINSRVASIAGIAEEHGLKVVGIAPGTPKPGRRFSAVPIAIQGSGNAAKFVEFLASLAKKLPDTSIPAFTLSGNPETPDSVATFSLELAWHAGPETEKGVDTDKDKGRNDGTTATTRAPESD